MEAPSKIKPSRGDFLTDARGPIVLNWWDRKRQEVVRLLYSFQAELAGLTPNGTGGVFLDMGCGSGRDLVLIYRIFSELLKDWQFVGCDADPGSGRLLQNELKRVDLQPGAVKFQEVDLNKELPFRNESIHLIYCSEVVEHLPDPINVFHEFYRILVKGGFVLLTTPNQPAPFEKAFYLKVREPVIFQNRQSKAISVDPKTNYYGHISLHQIAVWEKMLSEVGLKRVGIGRGALRYDLPESLKSSYLGLSLYYLLESLADAIPRKLSYRLGSQYIAMIRKE